MITNYNELNEPQRNNLVHFLDRAQTNHLDKMKKGYAVGHARSLGGYRQNVLDSLMFTLIPFNDFIDWLCHVELEGNNTLFIYEPNDASIFEKHTLEHVYSSASRILVNIYNVNADELEDIKLVNVQKENQQLIFTLAAPSTLQIKDQESGAITLKKYIYLAYIIMDYDLKHFVLSMHPTTYVTSIAGETKKKEWDELTWILINKFRKLVINFEFSEPRWLTKALYKITHEFFYHNNPIIEEKLKQFENEAINNILKIVVQNEKSFSRDEHKLRFKKSLLKMYENELISLYKPMPRETSFEVFLQQTDKGVTEFKANSKGRAMSYAEAGEIIDLMWENGNVISLGIIHYSPGEIKRRHPYIISKSDHYFSLKKFNTASTEKEVVNDVLRKLNKYKQAVRPTIGFSTDVELRINASETR
ncbi:hypothetical protein AV654_30355 [Paenibacillus elgii]|uniref:Uncharacterized protein n=1 Tax=Paenibacillus elgii TaxID=189691 RepID=A0A161S595_9BACL|nr:hypothetical protein [Paenibacillus elgii]KZE74275.1 hypothetical protein AV654_30355 [Paenibacillus elgii]